MMQMLLGSSKFKYKSKWMNVKHNSSSVFSPLVRCGKGEEVAEAYQAFDSLSRVVETFSSSFFSFPIFGDFVMILTFFGFF